MLLCSLLCLLVLRTHCAVFFSPAKATELKAVLTSRVSSLTGVPGGLASLQDEPDTMISSALPTKRLSAAGYDSMPPPRDSPYATVVQAQSQGLYATVGQRPLSGIIAGEEVDDAMSSDTHHLQGRHGHDELNVDHFAQDHMHQFPGVIPGESFEVYPDSPVHEFPGTIAGESFEVHSANQTHHLDGHIAGESFEVHHNYGSQHLHGRPGDDELHVDMFSPDHTHDMSGRVAGESFDVSTHDGAIHLPDSVAGESSLYHSDQDIDEDEMTNQTMTKKRRSRRHAPAAAAQGGEEFEQLHFQEIQTSRL